MILLIDNFDSFTGNLFHYMVEAGFEVVIARNNMISIAGIEDLSPEAIVFSPGPGRPKDHPLMFRILEKYAGQKPIIGVCLGHQAIGEFFGMKLVKAPYPMHGKISECMHNGHKMFSDVPYTFSVTRYHSLILQSSAEPDFEITAKTSDGLNMAMAARQNKIWTYQFHPEAILTIHGKKMVANWRLLIEEK